MYTIIGSENGERIECSAVVEEKKMLFQKKYISVKFHCFIK